MRYDTPMGVLVSVVIPMYDEAAGAARTLAEVGETLGRRGWDYELIPVSDGSHDATPAVLETLSAQDSRVRPVIYPVNRGRGYALRQGFALARGRFVATLDADLSYSPDHVVALVDHLLEHPGIDFALGSPYMPGGGWIGVPRFRLAVSRLGNRVLRNAFSEPIYTSTGILRAYRIEVLQALNLESDDKDIHLEVLSKALSLGFRSAEVPATLTARTRGSSHHRMGATVASHLLFTVLARPAMLFAWLGLALVLAGVSIGVYLIHVFLTGGLNPERPLVTVAVVLFLGGQSALGFAVLATQTIQVQRELLRLQRDVLALRRGGRADGDG